VFVSQGGGALAGKSLKAFQFVSVCSHFKKQLTELMALLNQLEPHYVRCIKPNPGSKPLLLDDLYALHQLKCGGVMEAVRISCAGGEGGIDWFGCALENRPGTVVGPPVAYALQCWHVSYQAQHRHVGLHSVAVGAMRCAGYVCLFQSPRCEPFQ
jgi:hypothetical protein